MWWWCCGHHLPTACVWYPAFCRYSARKTSRAGTPYGTWAVEAFGQRLESARRPTRVAHVLDEYVGADAGVRGVAPRHDRGPGGRAERLDIVGLELAPLHRRTPQGGPWCALEWGQGRTCAARWSRCGVRMMPAAALVVASPLGLAEL